MSESSTAVATVPAIVPAILEKALASITIAEDGRRSLLTAFAPHFQAFTDLKEKAKDIPITAPKAARTLRLELKAIRVASDKTRKDLKEDSLRRGKAIDGINAVLEYELAPIEKAMEDIEKAEEIAEAKRIEALKATRVEALTPFADPTFYDLGNMPQVQFDQLLTGAKAAHEAKLAAAAKAEADRIAAELAAKEAEAKRIADEAAERERMRAENERLAKVAAEEKAAREEQERAAAIEREKAKKEREAAEKQAAKERAEIEAKAKAERDEAERVVYVERQRRDAAEAELRAAQDAEAKRVAEAEAAVKKAAAAPDKQKLTTLAATVRGMAIPAMSSGAGTALRIKIAEQFAKMAGWIEAEAGKL